jgi:hypothetical protein
MPSPVLSDVKRSVKSSQKPAYVRARLENVIDSFRDQYHGVEKGKCMAERMNEATISSSSGKALRTRIRGEGSGEEDDGNQMAVHIMSLILTATNNLLCDVRQLWSSALRRIPSINSRTRLRWASPGS